MNIFMTGGAGFLGSALRKRLIDEGHNVISPSSKECDLTKLDSLCAFSDRNFDQIYHLAAWTQAGDFCLSYPADQWVINQRINTNVIDWWQKTQRNAKMIFMGTSCAYAPNIEMIEENYMLGEPIESLYTYAMTKRMLLQGARSMEKQYGLTWLCAVPSTIYGPKYHTDGRQMHFIFDLIRKILRAKVYGSEVVLWGDGSQRRELIYLDDFINNLLMANSFNNNQIINIGGGVDYSIDEFAKMICSIVRYDHKRIKYDESRYVGAKSKLLKIEKIQKINKNYLEQNTSIIVGLRKVIGWFEENLNLISEDN